MGIYFLGINLRAYLGVVSCAEESSLDSVESCLLRRAASESVGTNELGSLTGLGPGGAGCKLKATCAYVRRRGIKAGGVVFDFVSDFTDFGGDESEEDDISEEILMMKETRRSRGVMDDEGMRMERMMMMMMMMTE